MTREEAIERLNIHKSTSVFVDSIAEAIDMAIEALSKPSGNLISRADAIEAVKETKPIVRSTERNWGKMIAEQHSKELVKALKALPSAEQVTSKLNNPCNSLLTEESNGSKEHKSKLDLISRQDVIEALCRSSVYAWSIEQDQTAHDWALNIIKALPSADAVHGEWIRVGHDIYECSLCHQNVMTKDIDCYSYCHRCGTRMIGGDD